MANTSGTKRVRWTARMKDEFLDMLAATCHVANACTAIGVGPRSAYYLRRRDAGFAAAWQEALAQGYEMLETQLVGHALNGGGKTLSGGDPALPPIDVELAIKLLGEHRSQAGGKRAVGGARTLSATREETNAAILKKLKAIEARIARAESGEQSDPAGAVTPDHAV